MQSEETVSQSSVFTHVNFDVDVNEAVQLLGVSRTRLSQLVSKELLSFERRRVDTRLRMYFNRTELLGYLRRQMSGATAKVKQNEWVFEAEAQSQGSFALPYSTTEKTSESSVNSSRMFVSVLRHGSSPNLVRGAAPFKASALAIRKQQHLAAANENAKDTLRQELKNESRKWDKRIHQLQTLGSPAKANLISARQAVAEQQESTMERPQPRQAVRTLSKHKYQRVAVRN